MAARRSSPRVAFKALAYRVVPSRSGGTSEPTEERERERENSDWVSRSLDEGRATLTAEQIWRASVGPLWIVPHLSPGQDLAVTTGHDDLDPRRSDTGAGALDRKASATRAWHRHRR
jgi:hypothetical protein